MNLPNKLTILRVILIPFFLVALMVSCIPGGKWIALCIFCVAAITDTLDGQIARKYNLITNFGKFMDPLADKLLVCSAMIALIELDRIPAWVVIIIICDFGGCTVWVIEQIFIYAALFLTIVSLIDYLAKNKDVLKD